MKVMSPASRLSSVLAVLGISVFLQGAEGGDIDGDGRLSIRDFTALLDDQVPATGSLDAYDQSVCFSSAAEPAESFRLRILVSTNIYLEALRRAVPGSLPHWDPILTGAAPAQLIPDPRVRVRLDDITVVGGDSDVIELAVFFETVEKATHFSLIIEGDNGILRLDLTPARIGHYGWDYTSWRNLGAALGSRNVYRDGDIPVAVGPGPYLITGGRYVMSHGMVGELDTDKFPVPAGAHLILARARLARGTPAGKYKMRVLATSEVLLEDGTLVSPVIEEGGEITVETTVTGGWNEDFPPLGIDAERREVLGTVEFRVVNGNGVPQEIVAEGEPGETVAARIQMRSDVPLNSLRCDLVYPVDKLMPEGERPLNLFTNPEDGELYRYVPGAVAYHRIAGAAVVHFFLPGYLNAPVVDHRYPNRLLDYFKPLGVWTDIAEVRFRILDNVVAGEEIPLALPVRNLMCHESGQGIQFSCAGEFQPYSIEYPCDAELTPAECNWSYSRVTTTGSKILVVHAAEPPPPPPDHEIRLVVGEGVGAPGELVEVPLFASAAVSLNLLRVVLAVDTSVAYIESVGLRVVSGLSFEERYESFIRGESRAFTECTEEDLDGDGVPDRLCRTATPFAARLYSTDPSSFLLDVTATSFGYPDIDLTLVGILRVRIEDSPAAGETTIAAGMVPLPAAPLPTNAESGGIREPPTPGQRFSPIRSFEGGRITVRGFEEPRFLRGDSNDDGSVDLSDAVATLGFLFLGNEAPSCADAGDANDSGDIDITDPIFVLGALFLGTGPIPEPYPTCGIDASQDSLGCREGC